MIYRRWSPLITPPIIVGSIVTATLFCNFYLGGNERFFKKYGEQDSSQSPRMNEKRVVTTIC